MVSAVKYGFSAAASCMPEVHFDPINMVRNCTKLAGPVILYLAYAGIPTVYAGPTAYQICLWACKAMGGSGCELICAPVHAFGP